MNAIPQAVDMTVLNQFLLKNENQCHQVHNFCVWGKGVLAECLFQQNQNVNQWLAALVGHEGVARIFAEGSR